MSLVDSIRLAVLTVSPQKVVAEFALPDDSSHDGTCVQAKPHLRLPHPGNVCSFSRSRMLNAASAAERVWLWSSEAKPATAK